ncbi:MAG: glycoside hydrolase family 78 protein [Clostridiales bacterium]|nr:glycoside hydrolase family 78 protein [Clostridiales bacterium]
MDLPLGFIYAGPEYSTYEKFVNAPYIRRGFELKSAPEKAEVLICGLGFYKLFINGKDITKGALAPYISSPDDIIYYDRYDVAPLLKKGENVIGFILGNGMQNAPGGLIWDFDKARFRGAPRVAASLTAEFKDGEEFFLETDESFKTYPSPIYFDDLRSGTFYDARSEIDGWCEKGFDDSAWKNAVVCEKPRGEARLCDADPIVVAKELKPVKISRATLAEFPEKKVFTDMNKQYDPSNNSGWLYDFGVNAAGVFKLHINGKKGQTLEFQFCEYIDANGNPTYRNIHFYPKGHSQRDIYICRGGEETYVPDFTYHGYRYCVVMGLDDDQATEGLLTYLVMNSDIDNDRAAFECSDKISNAIYDCTQRSDLANFYYFPTDCPHREKNGWTGDASMSSEHMLLTLSPERSYLEWLRNIRKAQREDGSLPGIIPTGGWGYEWGNGPTWDSVLTWLPYFTYKYRGDTEILKENADSIFRYLNYISQKRSDDGLIAIGLGDWVPVGRSAGAYKSPLVVTDTLVSMSICKYASKIFDVLGLKLQKAFADSLYDEFRTAARKRFIGRDGVTVLGRCQTSQAAGIYFDLFDDSEKPAAFKLLLDLIDEANDFVDVGMIGFRVLFRVLCDFGEAEKAYKLITRPEYPSYGEWIHRGATSLYEAFWAPDDEPDSMNHHFLGDIKYFYISDVVGIKVNPFCDDPSEINICPAFISQLDYAAAHYDSVAGRVEVRWERQSDGVMLKINAASDAHGVIEAPAGYKFVSDKERYNDVYVLPLESGEYKLVLKR